MATVRELLRMASELPGDSPGRDAEILLCHCLGKPRSWLYTWPDREPEPALQAHFESLLQRRRCGEPVAYLTGRREFWSLSLAVNEHTLIPRPETEALVEWALDLPLPEGARALDLGTGTGAMWSKIYRDQYPVYVSPDLVDCDYTSSSSISPSRYGSSM